MQEENVEARRRCQRLRAAKEGKRVLPFPLLAGGAMMEGDAVYSRDGVIPAC